MDYKRAPWERIILVAIEIAFAVNIILLDIWIFGQIRNVTQPKAASSVVKQSTNIVSPLVVPSTPTSIPQPEISTNQQTQNYSVKEYFVPLGSGSGNGTDWTDVASLQAYVDSSLYPNIKQVTFEVSAQIPTGNQTVYIRLFNLTAQHPVWVSDVTLNGGNSVLLISQPITLNPGSNLYQVQMKTQLGYPVTINQARIHIRLN